MVIIVFCLKSIPIGGFDTIIEPTSKLPNLTRSGISSSPHYIRLVDVLTIQYQTDTALHAEMLQIARKQSSNLPCLISKCKGFALQAAFFTRYKGNSPWSAAETLGLSKLRKKGPPPKIRERKPPLRSSNELKIEMETLFADPYLSKPTVDMFMYDRIDECDVANLSNLMRLSGKLMKSRKDLLMKVHMPAIGSRLETLSSLPWSFINIAFIFYGLQRMKESDNGLTRILKIMTEIAGEASLKEQKPSAQNISMILLGFQKNKCADEATKNLLPLVAKLISSCTDKFDAQHISTSLYGMQSMSTACPHVRLILTALTAKIETCTEDFLSHNVGQSLKGLSGMSSDYTETRMLLTALEPKIIGCKDIIAAVDVANSLSGLQEVTSECQEVRSMLVALTPLIQKCKEILEPEAVGDALFGLQGLSSDRTEVMGLLQALAPRVKEIEKPPLTSDSDKPVIARPLRGPFKRDPGYDGIPTLDSRAVANAMYGLRRMSSDSSEVRLLLGALAPRILSCKMTMNAHHIGQAFNGLQGFTSCKSEVRAILTALTPRIYECTQPFSSEILGDALYRLRRMSTDSSEVRELLAALAPKVKGCLHPLSSRAVGKALYGLQGLSSEYPEVRALVRLLCPKVEGCIKPLSGKSICYALSGLQEMSSESREVRMLLTALIPKIRSCTEVMSSDALARSMYGLQGIDTNCSEGLALISALALKVEENQTHSLQQEVVSADIIGKALYGLQGVKGEECSLILFQFLFQKLELLSISSKEFRDVGSETLLFLTQNLRLSGLQLREFRGIDLKKWEIISAVAHRELRQRQLNLADEYFSVKKKVSLVEGRVVSVGQKMYEGSGIIVEGKGELPGLFESDIIIKIPIKNSIEEYITIDIEISNVYHVQEKKQRYCLLRDKYLTSYGIIVERLDLGDLRKMKDKDLMNWINQRVLAAQP